MNSPANSPSNSPSNRKKHIRKAIKEVEQFQISNPGLVLSAAEVSELLEKVVAVSATKAIKLKEKSRENNKENLENSLVGSSSPPLKRFIPSPTAFYSPITALPLAFPINISSAASNTTMTTSATTRIPFDDDEEDSGDVFFTPTSTPSSKASATASFFKKRQIPQPSLLQVYPVSVSPTPLSSNSSTILRKSAIPRRVLSSSTHQPQLVSAATSTALSSSATVAPTTPHKPSQLSKSTTNPSPSTTEPTQPTDGTSSDQSDGGYFSTSALPTANILSPTFAQCTSSCSSLIVSIKDDEDIEIDKEGPPSTLFSIDNHLSISWDGEANGTLSSPLVVHQEGEKDENQERTITNLRKVLHETLKSYDHNTMYHQEKILRLQEEVDHLKQRSGSGRASSVTGSLESGSANHLSFGGGDSVMSLSNVRGRRRGSLEQLECLEEEVGKLTKELTDSRTLNKKLKAQLDRRNESNAKMQEELDQKEIICTGLEYRIEVLEKDMKKKTEESSTLASIVTKLQAELTFSAQVVLKITEENKALSLQCADLEKNMKDIMEMMNVEQDSDDANAIARKNGHDDFSFGVHERSRSLHYELSNCSHTNILQEDLIPETDLLQTLHKTATTRPNSTQTTPSPTTTTSTQSIPTIEFSHSKGTCTLTIETLSTACQNVPKTRDAECSYSPVDTVTVGNQTISRDLISTASQSPPPPVYTSFASQTVVETMDSGVGCTDHVFTRHMDIQTETPRLTDSGLVSVFSFCGVEACDRAVQTERKELMDSGIVDLFSLDSVLMAIGETQTESSQTVGRGMQTDVCVSASEAFGKCMVGCGVQTSIDNEGWVEMVGAVERVAELEAVVERMEGEVEGKWRGEVEALVLVCDTMKKEVKELQTSILENRRQLNIRKHCDEEVERWIEGLKDRLVDVENVIEPAREALEKRETLEDTLVRRVQALLELKGEYEESIRRLEEARLVDEEKHQQQLCDMSLLTLSSHVVNDLVPAEEWSDEDEELASKSTKLRSSSISIKQLQKPARNNVTTAEKIAAYVILPILALSYLSSSTFTAFGGNGASFGLVRPFIQTSNDAFLNGADSS
ncbi:UNVERIFIED_CONTAM: hypothetical protein HDU68_006745, partial [Siphonaria sp. JEL0065]